jgi:hypothetical protein
MRVRIAAAAAAISIGVAAAASAATLSVTSFERHDGAGARAALAAFQSGDASAFGTAQRVHGMKTESFERYRAWNGSRGASDPQRTNVGAFRSLGGKGTGHSAVNGGTKLQVRNESPWRWGRHDTSGVDGKWLDSNDTRGMRWTVKAKGLAGFNSVAFLLTDVADVGAKFSIKVGDQTFSQLVGRDRRTSNGSIQLVRLLLPQTVDRLTIELRNDRRNDGFGIDGATVAQVSPVPVPPAAALLVTGAAALFGLGGRRRRAAAAA